MVITQYKKGQLVFVNKVETAEFHINKFIAQRGYKPIHIGYGKFTDETFLAYLEKQGYEISEEYWLFSNELWLVVDSNKDGINLSSSNV